MYAPIECSEKTNPYCGLKRFHLKKDGGCWDLGYGVDIEVQRFDFREKFNSLEERYLPSTDHWYKSAGQTSEAADPGS